MLVLLFVAALSGALSVLTPCVLPLLPALLTVSAHNGRRRVAGLVLGITGSFVVITLLLGAALTRLGIPPRTFEILAAVMLVSFGLVLVVPPLERAFQRLASRASSRVPQFGRDGDGFMSGLASGSTLGLVWAPCAGPIVAGVTVAAGVGGFTLRTVAIALAYGAGMLLPLTAICLGGQKLGVRLRGALGGGQRVLVPMGLVLIVTGVAVGSGAVTQLNREFADRISFTSTPIKALEERALARERQHDALAAEAQAGGGRPDKALLEAGGYPEYDGARVDQGPAPQLAGIEKWFNTKGAPLRLKDLRGKVVLIDFWTYSCINCIRTLPYLRQLHDRYADKGLVIIGVHTPEFAFERDHGNIQRAMKDLGVTWPVAVDNEYKTWRNYYNQYWPAHYLIDRKGDIQQVHYGEGKYEETEQLVKDLLAERSAEGDRGASQPLAATSLGSAPSSEIQELRTLDRAENRGPQTPETYLGYARAERYLGRPTALVPGTRATYQAVPASDLKTDQWSLDGPWTVQDERAISHADSAEIRIAYRARDVYLVLGPERPGGRGTAVVREEGRPLRRIELSTNRLYVISRSNNERSGSLKISVPRGFAAYAFTFG